MFVTPWTCAGPTVPTSCRQRFDPLLHSVLLWIFQSHTTDLISMSDPLRAELVSAIAHKEQLRQKIEALERSLFVPPHKTFSARSASGAGGTLDRSSSSPPGYAADLRAGGRSVSPQMLSRYRKDIASRSYSRSPSPSPNGTTVNRSLSPVERSPSAARLSQRPEPVLSTPSLNPDQKKYTQERMTTLYEKHHKH